MSMRTRLLGGALVAFLALTGAARADTISFADAVSTLASDCGSDIKKFCKGLNLGNGRIQNCLVEHAAKVSPTCTATLVGVTASIEQRLAAQQSFTTICKHYVAQYCGDVKGEGNILACLNKATRVKEGQCGQAITDAGWR
ncbi:MULTISPECIES: cysteine rich repeat-containing protein [Ensifer]|jgi:hypothetical protein|uniref:Cysteine rich repeat-containing protein n=1 Tax=Ensifer canadensis TaxID=555315 RepID=A0AAW4FN17_9HYPH|nr:MULTISPECIES: cysteine rich repeat-containing protein [Ensifer]KQW50538.1 hypothetical protein ASD02_11550 [Ensifer sp. Root1252]KQW67161.1 hypothetical protein ASD03_09705 [Ensifer sp. Root127]KRC74762.1 hypothetical protein ASE32_07635 [Ensifer sp. Root231]KRC94848.1 hypothetical protein ASE47_08625 [Ensifer sp. Root258]MBM3092931.1 hypothetical protein [Ensifer canadensis]